MIAVLHVECELPIWEVKLSWTDSYFSRFGDEERVCFKEAEIPASPVSPAPSITWRSESEQSPCLLHLLCFPQEQPSASSSWYGLQLAHMLIWRALVISAYAYLGGMKCYFMATFILKELLPLPWARWLCLHSNQSPTHQLPLCFVLCLFVFCSCTFSGS